MSNVSPDHTLVVDYDARHVLRVNEDSAHECEGLSQ